MSDMPKELEQMRDEIFSYHGCLTGDCPHEKQKQCFEVIFESCFEAMSKDYVKKEFMNNPWREGYRTAREEFEQSHIPLADVQILLDALKFNSELVTWCSETNQKVPLTYGYGVENSRKALEEFAARINIKV